MTRNRRRRAGIGGQLEAFAHRVTEWAGSSWAFGGAVAVIGIWALLGPVYHFSDTWQLVINTGTTIITFLMVFLIQRSQNKDSLAIHLKLNEIVATLEREEQLVASSAPTGTRLPASNPSGRGGARL